jgi:myo-inositol catabolism protein IolC
MKPLYILPFDHRGSFAKKLLGFEYPPSPTNALKVVEMKKVVYDGFLQIWSQHPELQDAMAILIDLEFGQEIIKDAKEKGIPFALTTEKSGQELFYFQYGDRFGEQLLKHMPKYAKALVRYNPDEKDKNAAQLNRLKELSNFCKEHQIGFMFELLVQGESDQLELMTRSLQQITAHDIAPTLWKVEGLDDGQGWFDIAKHTQGADIIVLGRGESQDAVEDWLNEAASTQLVSGFAIGRTIFFKPLEQYRDQKITREEAVEQIANNYLHFINLWQGN